VVDFTGKMLLLKEQDEEKVIALRLTSNDICGISNDVFITALTSSLLLFDG
jgi:hypothetical protein